MACSTMNNFFKSRGVFITGTTGFLGKVLLEKLLRTCPDINVIYILLRKKKDKTVEQRFQEIFDCELFDKIRVSNPAVLKKVVSMNGDVTHPFFGLNTNDMELFRENVSVVFNVAASIRFTEPIKSAININLLSVRHLIQICQEMNNLVALIHVSTAYSNCTKSSIDEIIYKPNLNPSKVIEIFENLDDSTADKIYQSILGEFPNTYTYTKHLAEYLFLKEGGNLPRAIIRPGAVTCAWEDPFPGWIDSRSVWGGIGIAMGLGITRHTYCDYNIATHVVPVDFCVNMFITAARQTAVSCSDEVKVYHCVSGGSTKISTGAFADLWIKHSSKYPLNNMVRVPSVWSHKNYFLQYILSLLDYFIFIFPMDYMLKISGKKTILRTVFQHVNKNMQSFEFFSKKEWNFSNENTNYLWNSLTAEEKKIYNFDLKQINWSQHVEHYVYGCKIYHLKEKLSTLPAARNRFKLLLWISRIWNVFKWSLLWILFFKVNGMLQTTIMKPVYLVSYVGMIVVLRVLRFII